MIKIGIDFSINSTALVINDSETFSFFSFVPNYKSTLKGFKYHEMLKDKNFLTVITYEKIGNDKNPIKEQINKLTNADRLSKSILEVLEKYKDREIEIRIEGFSYGSTGSSFIDLIVYNTFLKVKLLECFGVQSIKVIPPKTVKKAYTRNGNANKCIMFKQFIKEDLKISAGLRCEEFIKGDDFQIPKPIDDIVDAYALSVIQISE